MALNLSAFGIKSSTQTSGLNLSAFGGSSTPYTVPKTPLVLIPKPSYDFSSASPTFLRAPQTTDIPIPNNVAGYNTGNQSVKVPFSNQILKPIFNRGASFVGADNTLNSLVKWIAELPEEGLNTIVDAYNSIIKGTPTQTKPNIPRVGTPISVVGDTYQKALDNGHSPLVSSGMAIGASVLKFANDFAPLSPFVPVVAKTMISTLPRQFLEKLITSEIPAAEIRATLTGAEGATLRSRTFVNSLSNQERKDLFGVLQEAEKTGAPITAIEGNAPTKLGEYAGVKPLNTSAFARNAPEQQLPGYMNPSPQAGAINPPREPVGFGDKGIPQDLQPLALEAQKYKSAELNKGYKQFSKAQEQAVNILNKYGDSKIDVYGSFSTGVRRGSGKVFPDLDLIIEDPKIAQDFLDNNREIIANREAYAKKHNAISDTNRFKTPFEAVGRLDIPEKYQDLSNKFSDVKIKINDHWFSIHADGTARALGDSLIKEQLVNRKPLKQALEDFQKNYTKSQLTDFYSKVTKPKETGGIGGNKGLKTVGLAPEPSPKIVRTEQQLLNERIRSEARGTKQGVKVGRAQAKEEIVNQLRNTFETKIGEVKRAGELQALKTGIKVNDRERVKTDIVSYIKDNIPISEQGHFITMVKNAQTQKDLIRGFLRVDAKAQQIELKQSITTLRKTVEKLSESPAVSADYRNKIKDIISNYELKGHTQATIDEFKATQAYLDGVKSTGVDAEIPQRILDKLKILSRIPKDKLTLSQVQGLQNEIELLGKLGETKWASKQALYDAEKEARKNVLLDSASSINPKVLPKAPIGTETSKWAERYIAARNYFQKSRIGLTPIEGLADITGMQPMKEALDLNFGNYLTYNDVAIKQWYEMTKNFTQKEFERIGAYAISQQSGGIERLANSGITQKEIDAIKLNPEEQKAYQFVIDKFNSEFPAVKKYALDTYNADVGQVDNYVSFMSDFDAMSDLEMYDRFGQRAEEVASRRSKTVEQGFTKERAAIAKNKLELDINKIFRRHLDDVAYMLTMGRDVKMYFEIVNSPEVRAKLGDVGALAWLQYLDLMARKGGTEGAKRIAALDVLRRNIGAGVLAFRVSSALVQFSSFADTIGTIGAEWATKGAVSISTSKEWRNFIMDNFPEIKKAVGDDIAFREFGDGMLGKATQVGLKPLQMLDGIMRSTAASGAYQKLAGEAGITIDLKNPDKNLIQKATKLMRQSQGSSFFKDQPLAITAGYGITDNKSLNKAILTFQSFMLARWDNMQRQIWRMGIKEKDYKKASMAFFWLVIFAASLEEGIRRGTRKIINLATGDNPPEKSFVGNAVGQAIQSIPIVGQLASSISYSSNPVPMINSFEDIISGVGSTISGAALNTKMRGAIQAIGAAGSLSGVPGASQGAQIIRKAIPQAKGGSSSDAQSILSKYGIKSQNVDAGAILKKYGIK